VINVNATLTHGNPSIKVVYTCSAIEHELQCFSWPNPSTILFVSDTFVCDCVNIVRARILGYASSNCNGTTCVELGLTNLDLKPKKKDTVATYKPSWFISRNRLITDFDEQTILVYTVSGVLLFSNTSNNTVTYLPKFDDGMYVLIIQTPNKRIIKKILWMNYY